MGDERETVGICLMKGDEADATISHLLDRLPDMRVADHITYFRVESESDICIDLREVAAYLGRNLPMSSFLITLSAYFGEIHVNEDALRISPVLLRDDGALGASTGPEPPG